MGIAKCNVGHYREGEEHLSMVQNEKVTPMFSIVVLYVMGHGNLFTCAV
jgi:hypothetical protein